MHQLRHTFTCLAKQFCGFTFLGLALIGCSQDGSMEETGKMMDESYESVKETTQNLGEKITTAGQETLDSAAKMGMKTKEVVVDSATKAKEAATDMGMQSKEVIVDSATKAKEAAADLEKSAQEKLDKAKMY